VDWILIAFVLIKGGVFVAGMYVAVKWHYDREKTAANRRALVRMGITYAVAFVLLLVVLLSLTLEFAHLIGMDLTLS